MGTGNDETNSRTVYCTECGEEISPDTNFCPECGSEQGVESGDREDSAGGTNSADREDAAGGEDSADGGGYVGRLGRYAAWAGGGILVLAGLGALTDGTPRSVGAGVVSLAIGLFFLPVVRDRAGIGTLPGIDPQHTSRRNVLTGVAYGLGGLLTVGAIAPETESDASDDGGTTGGEAGGSSGDETTEAEYPNAWYVDEDTEIVLRNVEGSVGQFSVEITGEATNESGRDYDYVQLEFGLYDATDAKVGDALANTSGLSAGQRWRFEAMGTNAESTESFRIEGVTAY